MSETIEPHFHSNIPDLPYIRGIHFETITGFKHLK